jgi:flagellar hook-length control protein FliK
VLPVAFEVVSATAPHSGRKPGGKADREGPPQFANMLDHASAPAGTPVAKDQKPQSTGAKTAAPAGKGAQPSAASANAKPDDKSPKTEAAADASQTAQSVLAEPAGDQAAVPNVEIAAKTPDDRKLDVIPAGDVTDPTPQPDNSDAIKQALAAALSDLTGEPVASGKPKPNVSAKSEKASAEDMKTAKTPDGADDAESPSNVIAVVVPATAVAAVVTPVIDATAPVAPDTAAAGNAVPGVTGKEVAPPNTASVVAVDPNGLTDADATASIELAPQVVAKEPGDGKTGKAADVAKPQLADASADPLPTADAQTADAPEVAAALKAALPDAQPDQPSVHSVQAHAAHTQATDSAPNSEPTAPNVEGGIQGGAPGGIQASPPTGAAGPTAAAHNAPIEIVKPVPSQHDSPHDDAAPAGKTSDPLQPATLPQTTNVAAPSTTDRIAMPAAAAAAVPVAGIAIEIASKALAGKHSFEIRLDPPELGRIHVRLDVDRNGEISSRVTADRSDTLDLLRRDAPALERALQDAGLKTASNGLQFSLRDHGFGRNDQPVPMSDSARVVVSDESLTAETITPAYRAFTGGRAGVDIRV